MQHELPPLRFGKKAERGHPLMRVAAADLPEQRAVSLRLHVHLRQVRGFSGAAAIVSMTGRATLPEDLLPSRLRARPVHQRIGFRRSLSRRQPTGIVFSLLTPCDRSHPCHRRREHRRRRDERQQESQR
jgi:hypothetical protein